MEDLLKEDDFAAKVTYNPWKLFKWFYASVAVEFIIFLMLFAFFDIQENNNIVFVLLIFGLPTVMTFSMFFWKKQNTLLPFKTMALAAFIMVGLFYTVFLCLILYSGTSTLDAIVGLVVFCVINYLFCWGIIYFVMRSAKKKLIGT